MFGMHPGKPPKVIAIQGGGVRHARVAQEQGENRSKGHPHDHDGAALAGPLSQRPLQNSGGHKAPRAGCRGLVHFLPGNHPQHADVHDQVEHSNDHD